MDAARLRHRGDRRRDRRRRVRLRRGVRRQRPLDHRLAGLRCRPGCGLRHGVQRRHVGRAGAADDGDARPQRPHRPLGRRSHGWQRHHRRRWRSWRRRHRHRSRCHLRLGGHRQRLRCADSGAEGRQFSRGEQRRHGQRRRHRRVADRRRRSRRLHRRPGIHRSCIRGVDPRQPQCVGEDLGVPRHGTGDARRARQRLHRSVRRHHRAGPPRKRRPGRPVPPRRHHLAEPARRSADPGRNGER